MYVPCAFVLQTFNTMHSNALYTWTLVLLALVGLDITAPAPSSRNKRQTQNTTTIHQQLQSPCADPNHASHEAGPLMTTATTPNNEIYSNIADHSHQMEPRVQNLIQQYVSIHYSLYVSLK